MSIDILLCTDAVGALVAEWYEAGLAIARSRVRLLPVAAVYQRQLGVPSLRGRV